MNLFCNNLLHTLLTVTITENGCSNVPTHKEFLDMYASERDRIAMAKPGRKASKKPDPDAVTTRAWRMKNSYAVWLEDFAVLNRTSLSGLFDQALVEYAKTKGFKPPPPRT
jgi:hypothetical protein